MSTLIVVPDIYRLNAAQRDQLHNLVDAGVIKNPVMVKRRASGRVLARGKDGRTWIFERDGMATLAPDR